MSVTDIIFADMVPLPERGKFQGIAAAYVYLLDDCYAFAHVTSYSSQNMGSCKVRWIVQVLLLWMLTLYNSAVGPPIGGALASTGKWRWLFFLNLPLCAVATVFIVFFFHSHVPTTSFKSKLLSMDWT